MDLAPPTKKPKKVEPVKKEVGEYFDFPCPKCGKKKVKSIAYGLPIGPDSFAPNEIIGGCCIDNDSPGWHCENCKYEWGEADNF
jgi:hypothetical protein